MWGAVATPTRPALGDRSIGGVHVVAAGGRLHDPHVSSPFPARAGAGQGSTGVGVPKEMDFDSC